MIDFSGGINIDEMSSGLPSPGGGLPGRGGGGLPGPMAGRGLPTANEARQGMSATLVDMLPHIMNTLGDSSPAVTNHINKIQAESAAQVQRERLIAAEAKKKANLSRFGAAIFSKGDRLDGNHVMQMAEQLGIEPQDAMDYLSKFQKWRAAKRGPSMKFSRSLEGGGVQTVNGYAADRERLLGDGFMEGTVSGLPKPNKPQGPIKTERGLWDPSTRSIIPDTGPLPEPEKHKYISTAQGVFDTRTRKIVPGTEKVPRGTVIESDGKGGFTVRTNADQGKGGAGGLTKPVKTQVQKDLLDAADNLSRISEIENLFDPNFQLIGTKINASRLATLDKLGRQLDPDDQKVLDDFTEYKASAGQMVADTLRKMSGAAVTESEAKRAYEYIPKPGTGWLDGDSPRQIQAKIKRFKSFSRRATARLNFINRHGMSIEDIPLGNIDKMIDRRGEELEQELSGSLEGDKLEVAVKQKLAEEFGLVF